MMTIQTFHVIQAWLVLDAISGLWLVYAIHTAPLLKGYD